MITAEKRNFGLDLIRFTAVVFVVLAHSLPAVSGKSIISPVSSFTAIIGVELFFVLSGFLIGTILIKTHNLEPVTSVASIKTFWIRRWFRTLPNYYLMVLVYMALCLMAVHRSPIGFPKFLSYLVFLQDAFTQETNKYFNVSWSLCVEEWFYLLFPLILFLVQYKIPSRKKSFMAVILIFLLLPLAGRVFLALTGNLFWDAGFRKLTFTRLDSIGIGVLAAYINYYYQQFWYKNRVLLLLTGLALSVPLLIYIYIKVIASFDVQVGVEVADAGFLMKTLFFSAFGLCIALTLPAVYHIKVNHNQWWCRTVTFISIISYSLYLLHPVVIALIQMFFTYPSAPLKLVLIWILSIAGAYLQYQFFEKRMTSMRDRFKVKKGAVVTV